MGNIQASAALVAVGAFSLNDSFASSFDMSADDMGGPVSQVIGTADEQIVFPADVATGKLVLLVNLDPTNYVQISYTAGGGFSSFSRLDPAPSAGQTGGFYFGRPESLTIYAKANGAACRIKVSIVPT